MERGLLAPDRSKKATRGLTRGSTPLYQVMKRDMKKRTPVRSGSPRVDSSTMLQTEGLPVAAACLSHLYYGSVLTEVVEQSR